MAGDDDGDGGDGPNGRIPVEALVGGDRKEGRHMKIKWMGGWGAFKAMRGGGMGDTDDYAYGMVVMIKRHDNKVDGWSWFKAIRGREKIRAGTRQLNNHQY